MSRGICLIPRLCFPLSVSKDRLLHLVTDEMKKSDDLWEEGKIKCLVFYP